MGKRLAGKSAQGLEFRFDFGEHLRCRSNRRTFIQPHIDQQFRSGGLREKLLLQLRHPVNGQDE